MYLYKHLYVGEKAGKKRFAVLQSLRAHKPLPGIHVITPAINGNNILDIYSAWELEKAYYQEMDMLILGIGADYFETLQVAGVMIDELYQKTGGFDLRLLLE